MTIPSAPEAEGNEAEELVSQAARAAGDSERARAARGPSRPAEPRPVRPLWRVAHGALRGVIGAMAMTGLREFTRHVGLLEEPPPEAIVRQRLLPGPFRRVRTGHHRAEVELLHWSYGAAAGAAFAALPRALRLRPWAGPLYGLAVWGGFELGIAPALGLAQAHRKRPLDRVALAVDHLLYGLVLAETRRIAPP